MEQSPRDILTTRDDVAQRDYVCAWGICPECERETLLYTHVSHRYQRCGHCLEPALRAFP